MSRRKIVVASLAASLLALSASSAQGANRTAHDPCSGDEAQTLPYQDYRQIVCMTKFEIPPHRTMVDPSTGANTSCAKGFYIHGEVTAGNWGDYWTFRGEWVTWSPLGGTHSIKGVSPAYHNWSSWNWPTRTLLHCSKLDALAVMARTVPTTDPRPDVELLGAGDDVDRGTAKDDDERGGKGDDTLSGGKGDDELLGGPGKDHLYGGPGNDELFDDQGEDVISAGPGNDRISVRDGNHDVVDCGPGDDIAIGDPHDTFRHCEHVYTTPENTPAHPPHIG
jgi:Ca2+-binding RTX toxin-like protein